MNASVRVRRAGWLTVVVIWLCLLAACEILAWAFGGFVLVDGRPADAKHHHENGIVRVDELSGVAVWRREHPDRPGPAPVKNGFRIIVLGDSVLEPAHLGDRDGMVRLLETQLNRRLDKGPYEVINLAEGGLNTRQEEQLLNHEGFGLDPDLVLVGVTANDLQEFTYRYGQLLEVSFLRDLERRPESGLWGFIARNSYLYNFLWLTQKSSHYARDNVGKRIEMNAVVEPLRRMATAAKEHGAGIALLCFPHLTAERFDVSEDRCPFEYLVDWSATENVPLLDPIPSYAAHPNADLRLDQIHLSKLGHRILTEATFDWLVAERLVPFDRVLPAASPAN